MVGIGTCRGQICLLLRSRHKSGSIDKLLVDKPAENSKRDAGENVLDCDGLDVQFVAKQKSRAWSALMLSFGCRVNKLWWRAQGSRQIFRGCDL